MKPKLVFRLYRSGTVALRFFPSPVARALGAILGTVFALSPGRRVTVQDNLAHVLGAEPGPALRAAVRQAFASYGIYWAEASRLRLLAARAVEENFSVEGFERIERAMKDGDGLILALPHLGCWEVGGRFLAERGIFLTSVAEVLRPPELFDWFVAEREALGLRILPLGPAATGELLGRLRVGEPVALVADRDLAGDGIEIQFFGSPARFPTGPAVLALRSGAPLLPVAIYHERGGRHHAIVLPAIDTTRTGRLRDDVRRVTEALGGSFEDLIGRAPEQWHVFQPHWLPAASTGESSARRGQNGGERHSVGPH
jgi:KDO2-lipid IV(A) lauroyltransferase